MSELEKMNSYDVPVCVHCGQATNGNQALVMSDAAGGPIHERECWRAYIETPEYKAQDAVAVSEHEEQVAWEYNGKVLGSHRKGLLAGFSNLQFDVGDWLVSGEEKGFVSVANYTKAELLTGYKVSCLHKFASVARRVPRGIRIPALPWAAHQAVAYIKDAEEQQKALKYAAAQVLSVAGLRSYIKTISPQQEVAPTTTREYTVEAREGHAALARLRLDEWSRALGSPEIGDELMAAMPKIRNREKLAERLKATAALLMRYAEIVESGNVPDNAETAVGAAL